MKFQKKTSLLLSLLVFLVAQAWADGLPQVTYIDCTWNSANHQVNTEPKTITDYVVFQNSSTLTLSNDYKYWVVPAGKTVTVSDAITISGDDVHIILSNGSTLICKGGIRVEGDNKLHIHATPHTDGEAVGQLNVSNQYKNYAGIGSGKDVSSGDIFIHGGDITATGGAGAAAIGAGAAEESHPVGHVTIFGGKVTATGDNEAAGIGSGTYRGYTKGKSGSARVTIYDGEIYAFGGNKAAGIGTGYGGQDDGSIDIYGGTIYAKGGDFGSGIGGGHKSGGGTVHIHATNASHYSVTAVGGKKGAGIGSGAQESDRELSGEVIIEGAIVEATGGSYGAGIGLGYQHGADCSMSITITGGHVYAKGGTDAAGIGIGENQSMFISNNPTVVHIGGSAEVRAEGNCYGAGIGGGEDFKGANVTIDGQASVTAIAGSDCNATEKKGGSAIGSGDISWYSSVDNKESISGNLSIASELKVVAGAQENSVATSTESGRIDACRWNNFARVEPCGHGEFSYTLDDDTHHTKHCKYCQYTCQENHSYTDGECVCGRKENAQNTYYAVELSTTSGVTVTQYDRSSIRNCASGKTFILPTPEEIDGLTFMGWQESQQEGTYKYLLKNNETVKYKAGDAITVNAPVHLYARYIYKAKSLKWNWNEDYTSASLTISIRGTISTWSDVTVSAETKEATASEEGYERHTATATKQLEGYTYTFTDEVVTPHRHEVVLQDDQDNSEALHNVSGYLVNTVIINGRTLYKDGSWNTLCLPFSLTETQIASSVLRDAEIQAFTNSQFEKGTLTLNFTSATTIQAGKPYLVKWAPGENIMNPEFHQVMIDDESPEGVDSPYVTFLGIFSPVSLSANDVSVLYLGSDNKLHYPNADMKVKSCRAYFLLNGLDAADLSTDVSAFKLNFDDEGTNGITSVANGRKTIHITGWYTLDGRRLNAKPTVKGVYVNDGKKVVIP